MTKTPKSYETALLEAIEASRRTLAVDADELVALLSEYE